MLIIKVNGENKVRTLGATDYEITYNVKTSSRGLNYNLKIGSDIIINRDIESKGTDLTEMENNMETLVFAIVNLLALSTMGLNRNVYRIAIDPDTLVGSITRIGDTTLLENYDLLPN